MTVLKKRKYNGMIGLGGKAGGANLVLEVGASVYESMGLFLRVKYV